MAPPSHGLSKLVTFALHLILGSFRQLGCDLIQEAINEFAQAGTEVKSANKKSIGK